MWSLLDTHAVIWFITDDAQLPETTKSFIEDTDNTCFVSSASLWEIRIKSSLGKLELKTDLQEIFELISESGISLLPILPEHILINSQLPFHHRDPFDRLIIAQAKAENLQLISKDKELRDYDVNLSWEK